MKNFDYQKWMPLILGLLVAVIALVYYILSGQGSLDKNIRNLTATPNIDKVDYSEAKTVEIKCKNGQSYKIVFKRQQQNYDDLIFNTCGPDGAETRGESGNTQIP